MLPEYIYSPRFEQKYEFKKGWESFNSKTHKYITNKKLEFYEAFFAITHTNNSIRVV